MEREERYVRRVILVRHGQSMGNVDPTIHRAMADHAIPLSEEGRVQSREAGTRIRELLGRDPEPKKVRLWNSPYRRTRQTARELATSAGDVIFDQREHVLLCEQQFGLFDGIPEDELAGKFPMQWEQFDKHRRFEGKFWARMPAGESRFDVAVRVHQAFGTFQRDAVDHGIEDIVVVCHGVTLRAFVMMWCHFSPEWFEREPNPRNCAVRVLANGEDLGYAFEGFPPAH